MENTIEGIFGFAHDDDSDEDNEQLQLPPTKSTKANSTSKRLTVIRSELIDVGGGRGLFALQALPPGVLVASEVPTATWSEGTIDDPSYLATVVQLCCCNKAAYAITQLLHPRELVDCDEFELAKARELLSSAAVAEIVQNANLTDSEVIRVLLVLQHNGFGSGLYHSLTMLNHSCDPNAIKYSPSPGSFGASEIWTVRAIKEGEEITISYCEPLEMTRKSMRKYLELHHRFKCCCGHCVSSGAPVPAAFGSVMESIAQQEQRVQELVGGMEQEVLFWQNAQDMDGTVENLTKLLHSTTGMAAVESERTDFNLSPRILARLHRLAANTAAAFLEIAGRFQQQNKRPKRDLLKAAAFSFLRNSLCLVSEQLKYLGPHHPEVARAYLDIAEALDCALNTFPEELLSACGAGVGGEKNSMASYPELQLLQFAATDASTTRGVGKKAVRDEIKRFRAEGSRIKRLYTRSLFPALYRDLQGGSPGACHWGVDIPPEHHTAVTTPST